jgi:hypothetical protein
MRDCAVQALKRVNTIADNSETMIFQSAKNHVRTIEATVLKILPPKTALPGVTVTEPGRPALLMWWGLDLFQKPVYYFKNRYYF